jgi:hypothetical protein
MDYACSQSEAQFVDDTLVQYRVLGTGELPGDSLRPLGWTFQGRDRDIDKRVSTGTRTVSVRLSVGTDSIAEPTCAEVRAAAYPTP